MLSSTLPTRRNVAGEDVMYNNNTLFFQLAVFGLVSFLCAAAALQHAHPASQANNLVNILAITSISLARLASSRYVGPPSATHVASKPLPPPTPSGIVDNVKSKVQSLVTGSPSELRSTASRWARSIMPRLPSVRTLRL
jgi:hypothetical protein